MNKTIIINISGIIFHIEEDAYDILRNYMNDVKRYFSNSVDSFEIVTDIENRIAEMFGDILKEENKQVILSEDVRKIIAQMGNTSEFGTEEIAAAQAEPAGKTENPKKRLYRNSDDKIVGGVCSGIAAYFDTDPIWIRLALVAAVAVFGTGVPLYIILWIIMPEAKTRSEKLAMKGEKITIDTIKRSVEEEPVRESHLRNFTQNVIELFGNAFRVLFMVISKLAGVFLVILGGLCIFIFSICLFAGLGITSIKGDFTQFPFNIVPESGSSLTFISWFFIVAIPAVAVLLLGLRMLIRFNPLNRTTGLGLLGIWILALIVGGYQGSEIAADFRETGTLKETHILQPLKNNTIHLSAGKDYDSFYEDSANTSILKMDGRVVVRSNYDRVYFGDVDINIEKSEGNEVRLITIYSSKGKDLASAVQSAANINYMFSQQDSVLKFDNHFTLREHMLWRDQHVKLTLFIPENTKVIVHDDLDRMVSNISSWQCKRNPMDEVEWKMTNYGLICDKEPEEKEDTFTN